jgi:hypothetical protein
MGAVCAGRLSWFFWKNRKGRIQKPTG